MHQLEDITDIMADIKRLRSQIPCRQLMAAFVVIPILLLAIDSLVNSQNWAISVTEPSIMASQTTLMKAFTSAYVHANPPHLWNNIGGYLLLISGILPLAVLAKRRKTLLLFSLVYLVLGPFWTSYFSLVIPFSMNSLGFSGINAAFLGYLPLLLFAAIRERTEFNIHPIWSLGPILLSFGAIIWYLPRVYPPMNPVPHLVLGFGLPGLVLTFWLSFRWYRQDIFDPTKWGKWGWIIGWGGLVLLLGLYALFFGIEPAIETNVFAHFGGYFLGYGLPFATELSACLQEFFS